jgi:hypothetical protein
MNISDSVIGQGGWFSVKYFYCLNLQGLAGTGFTGVLKKK